MASLRRLSVAGAAAMVLLALSSASAGQHQHSVDRKEEDVLLQHGTGNQEAGHADADASDEVFEIEQISKGGHGARGSPGW